MSKQAQPITAFTFTYREAATACIAPTKTQRCEGVQISDGEVCLRTPDKTWHTYHDIDAMLEAFGKHGRGTIRIVAQEYEEEEQEETA